MNTPFTYLSVWRVVKGVFFMHVERKRRGKRENGKKTWWQSMVAGIASTVAISVFGVGVGAVMIAAGVLPERAGDGCVLIACAVGSMIGICTVVQERGKNKMIVSIGLAAMASVVLGVSGILLYGGIEAERCFAVCAACLCGGGLAGAIGGRKRVKKGHK